MLAHRHAGQIQVDGGDLTPHRDTLHRLARIFPDTWLRRRPSADHRSGQGSGGQELPRGLFCRAFRGGFLRRLDPRRAREDAGATDTPSEDGTHWWRD